MVSSFGAGASGVCLEDFCLPPLHPHHRRPPKDGHRLHLDAPFALDACASHAQEVQSAASAESIVSVAEESVDFSAANGCSL